MSKNTYERSKIQNYKCFYCQCDLIPPHPNQKKPYGDNPSKDHIVPKSEFTKKLIDSNVGLSHNIVISCRKCNCERNNMDFITFFIKKRGF